MLENTKSPLIMGILNVTPDSFSDGGDYLSMDDALDHGLNMLKDGVDIIDIGGESTRPGSQRVSAEIQQQRIIPVIKELSSELPSNKIISVDTTLTQVAEAAINEGATMINDISAGRDDPDMFKLAADRQVSLVIMHMLGNPGNMQINPEYDDVIKNICEFLIERARMAESCGVKSENIILDPGIGFGKLFVHNMDIVSNLHNITRLGYKVLLGVSRKRFLQTMVNSKDSAILATATATFTALGVYAGINVFRVHDVRQNRETADKVFNSLHKS